MKMVNIFSFYLLSFLFLSLPSVANTTIEQGVAGTTVPYIDAAKSADGATSSTALALKVNGTEYMRLTATGSVGIGTTAPHTVLQVNGSAMIGNGGETCSTAYSGTLRYNTGSTSLEFCNGSAWKQLAYQTPGSTTNVTASGPPVGATIYSFSSVTANYTPAYGALSNIYDGAWPANGTTTTLNATCVDLKNVAVTGAPQHTITIDLGESKTINNVYTSLDYSGVYITLGISFSTDGTNWNSSASIQGSSTNAAGTTIYVATQLSPSVTARYLKIANSGYGVNAQNNQTLCEFAIGP